MPKLLGILRIWKAVVATNFEETIHFDSEKSTIVLNCYLNT